MQLLIITYFYYNICKIVLLLILHGSDLHGGDLGLVLLQGHTGLPQEQGSHGHYSNNPQQQSTNLYSVL